MTIKTFDAFFNRVAQALGIRTQQELAALLGVNRSAVTQAKQRNTPPRTWILKLTQDFGLNPEWLEKGAGPQKLVQQRESDDEFVKIPKVEARLCAGDGSFETGDNIKEYYAFRQPWLSRKGNPDKMVLMDILGNSMEPELREGDTVLIDQSRQNVLAGGIYAVGVEDTVMVKRIEKRPGALVLISDNPDYSPIHLQGGELETVRVIGKLIWIAREYH